MDVANVPPVAVHTGHASRRGSTLQAESLRHNTRRQLTMTRLRFVLLTLSCSLISASAQQPVHELCKPCHSEITADFLNHPHAKAALSCDTCHGESVRHRESGGGTDPDRVAAPDQVPALCGTCHDHPVSHAAASAATLLRQYQSSKHGVFVAERSKVRAPHCATCHGEHGLRAARAIQLSCTRCHQQLPRACSGEPPSQASAVRCANCHAPHLFGLPR